MNVNIGRPEVSLPTNLKIRTSRTRAIPVSTPCCNLKIHFCSISRLSWKGTSGLRFLTSSTVVTHIGENVSSGLDTGQCEGVTDQLRLAAKHLNDQFHCCTSQVLVDEYSDLPTP